MSHHTPDFVHIVPILQKDLNTTPNQSNTLPKLSIIYLLGLGPVSFSESITWFSKSLLFLPYVSLISNHQLIVYHIVFIYVITYSCSFHAEPEGRDHILFVHSIFSLSDFWDLCTVTFIKLKIALISKETVEMIPALAPFHLCDTPISAS